MTRIPRAARAELSAEDQQIWDRIHAVRSGGGPYSVLLHVPALAGCLAETEDYFRLRSALADADREIIILTAARELARSALSLDAPRDPRAQGRRSPRGD